MAATIGDVAERAGVSIATVSRVLSGSPGGRPQTRERVQAAARELGYRPSGVAQSLKRRTTHTLGLIVTDIENPFFPDLVRAVEDAAHAAGYAVLLGNGAEDPGREAAYLELLASRRVDGLIVAASNLPERHDRWLAATALPAVLINCADSGGRLPAILSDNRQGGRLAVEHLVGLGHRRLGLVRGPERHAASSERQAGAEGALAGAEGALAGADEAQPLVVVDGDAHVAGGEAAGRLLMEREPETTAIVCYNDLTAIGVLRALRSSGRRVPTDVSVVGFDDIPLASYLDPPLTTIAQQTAVMGRWGVDQLLGRIAGREPDSTEPLRSSPGPPIILPVRLVIRGTTGVAPIRLGGGRSDRSRSHR